VALVDGEEIGEDLLECEARTPHGSTQGPGFGEDGHTSGQ
jgi:hypothetical protein